MKLIKSRKKEIVSSNYNEIEVFKRMILDNCWELGTDLGEVGIDQIIVDDEILKDIPLLSALYKVFKLTKSVHNWFFTKKVLTFIKSIHDGKITEKEWDEHMAKLQKDPKRMSKELEVLAINIDRHNKCIKEKVLANYYIEYITECIDWNQFNYFAEALDIISVYDFCTLDYIAKNEYLSINNKTNILSLKHLNNAGIIDYYNGMEVVSEGENDEKYIARITEFGRDFYTLGKIFECIVEIE